MASGFEDNYGWLDRMLHRLAFATSALQLDFAESEDRKLRDRIGNIPPRPPLFITALPRAGTTLLLDRFAGLDEFATHTYRDMPFVLAPSLWSRISGGFQQADVKAASRTSAITHSKTRNAFGFDASAPVAFFFASPRFRPTSSMQRRT